MKDFAQFLNLLSDYISRFCSILHNFCSQSGYAADSIQFLLPIYWHNMLADFVDGSLAKCGHEIFSFIVGIWPSLLPFVSKLPVFCYQGNYRNLTKRNIMLTSSAFVVFISSTRNDLDECKNSPVSKQIDHVEMRISFASSPQICKSYDKTRREPILIYTKIE